MATAPSIPTIDIAPLFGPPSDVRDGVDDRIMAAAAVPGFMTITGLADDIRVDAATRRQLLRLFDTPRTVIDKLSCNRHDPSQPLVYRGWFDLWKVRPSYFDGIEIGPDVAHGECVVDADDPLQGRTPMPSEAELPGWRALVRDYSLGMERAADAVMRSIARGLGVSEDSFSEAFVGGMSALRLLRYPELPPNAVAEEPSYVWHDGVKRAILSEAHRDFGCVTLLAQDEVEGLQVRMPDDAWVDIPPVEGQLVVNFGKLLERWTNRRIRATEHRVLSPGRKRFSLPFFFEPRVDARIAPLPLADAEPFAPFFYGDHVLASLPRLHRSIELSTAHRRFG